MLTQTLECDALLLAIVLDMITELLNPACGVDITPRSRDVDTLRLWVTSTISDHCTVAQFAKYVCMINVCLLRDAIICILSCMIIKWLGPSELSLNEQASTYS